MQLKSAKQAPYTDHHLMVPAQMAQDLRRMEQALAGKRLKEPFGGEGMVVPVATLTVHKIEEFFGFMPLHAAQYIVHTARQVAESTGEQCVKLRFAPIGMVGRQKPKDDTLFAAVLDTNGIMERKSGSTHKELNYGGTSSSAAMGAGDTAAFFKGRDTGTFALIIQKASAADIERQEINLPPIIQAAIATLSPQEIRTIEMAYQAATPAEQKTIAAVAQNLVALQTASTKIDIDTNIQATIHQTTKALQKVATTFEALPIPLQQATTKLVNATVTAAKEMTQTLSIVAKVERAIAAPPPVANEGMADIKTTRAAIQRIEQAQAESKAPQRQVIAQLIQSKAPEILPLIRRPEPPAPSLSAAVKAAVRFTPPAPPANLNTAPKPAPAKTETKPETRPHQTAKVDTQKPSLAPIAQAIKPTAAQAEPVSVATHTPNTVRPTAAASTTPQPTAKQPQPAKPTEVEPTAKKPDPIRSEPQAAPRPAPQPTARLVEPTTPVPPSRPETTKRPEPTPTPKPTPDTTARPTAAPNTTPQPTARPVEPTTPVPPSRPETTKRPEPTPTPKPTPDTTARPTAAPSTTPQSTAKQPQPAKPTVAEPTAKKPGPVRSEPQAAPRPAPQPTARPVESTNPVPPSRPETVTRPEPTPAHKSAPATAPKQSDPKPAEVKPEPQAAPRPVPQPTVKPIEPAPAPKPAPDKAPKQPESNPTAPTPQPKPVPQPASEPAKPPRPEPLHEAEIFRAEPAAPPPTNYSGAGWNVVRDVAQHTNVEKSLWDIAKEQVTNVVTSALRHIESEPISPPQPIRSPVPPKPKDHCPFGGEKCECIKKFNRAASPVRQAKAFFSNLLNGATAAKTGAPPSPS